MQGLESNTPFLAEKKHEVLGGQACGHRSPRLQPGPCPRQQGKSSCTDAWNTGSATLPICLDGEESACLHPSLSWHSSGLSAGTAGKVTLLQASLTPPTSCPNPFKGLCLLALRYGEGVSLRNCTMVPLTSRLGDCKHSWDSSNDLPPRLPRASSALFINSPVPFLCPTDCLGIAGPREESVAPIGQRAWQMRSLRC